MTPHIGEQARSSTAGPTGAMLADMMAAFAAEQAEVDAGVLPATAFHKNCCNRPGGGRAAREHPGAHPRRRHAGAIGEGRAAARLWRPPRCADLR
jgi:hypothetical protein